MHVSLTVVRSRQQLGTCAMKPREKGGVVDSRLNVYGIRGLKVADMSIAPSNVGTVSRLCLVPELVGPYARTQFLCRIPTLQRLLLGRRPRSSLLRTWAFKACRDLPEIWS